MKHAFQSMHISQRVVDNIAVMRKYGFIDFVLNQKVVSSFLQQCCGVMGLNAVKYFTRLLRNYFQDTSINTLRTGDADLRF
jgi:hypothetical protein